jgi:hypothetical protein
MHAPHYMDIETPLRDAMRLADAIGELEIGRITSTLELDDGSWNEVMITLQDRLRAELRKAVNIFDAVPVVPPAA